MYCFVDFVCFPCKSDGRVIGIELKQRVFFSHLFSLVNFISCNESCGTCAPVGGGVCTMEFCGTPCGDFQCPLGQECCNEYVVYYFHEKQLLDVISEVKCLTRNCFYSHAVDPVELVSTQAVSAL